MHLIFIFLIRNKDKFLLIREKEKDEGPFSQNIKPNQRACSTMNYRWKTNLTKWNSPKRIGTRSPKEGIEMKWNLTI